MALTSASTQAEALAQYNDNLAWDGNTTKAQNALEAVRWLLVNRAASQSIAGINLNYSDLQNEKKRLEDFVIATKTGGQRASFVRARAL